MASWTLGNLLRAPPVPEWVQQAWTSGVRQGVMSLLQMSNDRLMASQSEETQDLLLEFVGEGALLASHLSTSLESLSYLLERSPSSLQEEASFSSSEGPDLIVCAIRGLRWAGTRDPLLALPLFRMLGAILRTVPLASRWLMAFNELPALCRAYLSPAQSPVLLKECLFFLANWTAGDLVNREMVVKTLHLTDSLLTLCLQSVHQVQREACFVLANLIVLPPVVQAASSRAFLVIVREKLEDVNDTRLIQALCYLVYSLATQLPQVRHPIPFPCVFDGLGSDG